MLAASTAFVPLAVVPVMAEVAAEVERAVSTAAVLLMMVLVVAALLVVATVVEAALLLLPVMVVKVVVLILGMVVVVKIRIAGGRRGQVASETNMKVAVIAAELSLTPATTA